MAVAEAAGHPRCGAPSSSSRPRTRSQGCQRTSSLWARGRAPPGRRRECRRTGELCPEPASPPPRAPHQRGADAPTPPSPTDATHKCRLPSSALDSAPKPRRRICQTATRSTASSPCSRATRGTPCTQHGTMTHVSCRGPKAWPMARTSTTRLARRHGVARRSADMARHARAACRADMARWPSTPKLFMCTGTTGKVFPKQQSICSKKFKCVANMASYAISSSLILVVHDNMIIGTNHIVLACLCRHL
jgi:hypothetical protein